MEECSPINTLIDCGIKLAKHDEGSTVDSTYFKSLVGSLRHLTCIRPNIFYGVGLVSQYMKEPKSTHLLTAKRILRYIKGTLSYGLFYSISDNFQLFGYIDSDWAEDLDERKSTNGYVFFMGNIACS